MAALTVAVTPLVAPGCPGTPRARASLTVARQSAATMVARTAVLMVALVVKDPQTAVP
jgi:hypothetical protein